MSTSATTERSPGSPAAPAASARASRAPAGGLGASVVLSDIDADNGEKVAAEIGGTFVACDVSSYDDNAAAVAAHRSSCTAGSTSPSSTPESRAASASATTSTSSATAGRWASTSTVSCSACTPHSRAMQDRGGHIVATASLAGLVATPFDPLYGANKHGVVGLVRAAGAAYAGRGVFINAICPGFADTNIVSAEARQASVVHRGAAARRRTAWSTRSSRRSRAARAASAGTSSRGGRASRSGSATCPVRATRPAAGLGAGRRRPGRH